MADWDKTDLLNRVKRDGRIPATTAFPADADIYAWLTRAEALWKPRICSVYPYFMFEAPTLMTSSDSGVTYVFASEAAPLAVEVYPALIGEPLVCGQFGDTSADYVWEGSKIRMPGNIARVFANGPYGRWVEAPGTIDASTDSTILPAGARQLLVDQALIYWSRAMPGLDPQRFLDQLDETWASVELSLKQANIKYGDAANRQRAKVSGLAYLHARYGG